MAGVYLSYPFCGQKCTYCNFASGVLPADLEPRYVAALEREIQSHEWCWTPETVYLGGGTPSRLEISSLVRLLDAIPGRPWMEATMEAAPGAITFEQASSWRDLGITRVSLGVQSFVDRELRRTGRRHNAQTVAREVEALRRAGIEEMNIDLIAGLPCQTIESWRESLAWVRRLAPPHVSVYMLEVDSDSNLGREILIHGQRYGASQAPSEELTADLYEIAVDELDQERYEISNFAKPGHESLHNLKYWRLEPYAGFGADAHSLDLGLRRQNVEAASDYAGRVLAGQSPQVEETPARPEERFFVGLRLMAGVEPTPAEWSTFEAPIRRFLEDGLLVRDGARLRLTRRGVLLSNEVFEEFLPDDRSA